MTRRKPLPDGRLFAVTGKNIVEYHFDKLVEMGWLNKTTVNQGEAEQNVFFKVICFPKFPIFQKVDIEEIESEPFTNYDLAAFNNKFSQPINGIQRFFIHVEYIVHPKLSQQVESLKKQLKKLWNKDVVSLVKLTYSSAKLYQDMVDCIVYPVCIYYYQRALYLFAYGQTPKQDSKNKWKKIDWYDYRLDRIIKLEELQEDVDIPLDFMQKCYGQSPPSPDDIKENMAAAWGFDFYKPQELLLLRFDQYFYANYIQGTERDEMFKKVSHTQAIKIITSNTQLEWEQRQHLLLTLQSRSPKDVYCKVDYRVNDNNIVMRLRAWGPNVEVILPWKLRQRMAEDMQATWKLYK
jgi:CRISPR-associated protein (TIGR03985 family)